MTHDPRLSVKLPRGVTLRDPLLLSSGCWEFAELLRPGRPDPRTFGGVITKAVTPEERAGNPGVRILPTPTGYLNSVGLKNPGIDKFCAEQLPVLLELGVGFFVNVAGHTEADFAMLIARVEERAAQLGDSTRAAEGAGLLGFELNLSCPNVDGGMFANDIRTFEQIIPASRKATDRLLIAKLSPDVTDIVVFARTSRELGADAVTVSNTYSGMWIDTITRKSKFARPSAGYSGAAVLPVALYRVWKVHRQFPDLPIFGSGGITDTDSAVQHLLAGSSVLELGSVLFRNANAPQEIQAGLSKYLDEHNVGSLSELVGAFEE
jgi:dihydroorotate dehydrogenase (NAD+) catalytic subunit